MKSSILFLSSAAVAMAGPLRNREPEPDVVVQIVTDIVTEVVHYTIVETASGPATTTTAPAAAVVIVTVTVEPPVSTTTTTPAAAVAVVTVTPDAQNKAAATTSTTSTEAAAAPTDYAAAEPVDDFTSTALYHHNVHRSNHSTADVTYSEKLASFAATLSARCVFAHDVTIGVDSEFPSYGQNIAMYAATDIENLSVNEFLAQSISNFWYNSEIDLYPGPYGGEPSMGDFDAWGHYSQVIWSGTTAIGCAIHKCAAGTMEDTMVSYMSTCNYYPAGNVDTEYASNVLAPLGRSTVRG